MSQNWQTKFAPLKPAWSILGTLQTAIANFTGLPPDCKVLTGVHDSNASLARFLKMPEEQRPVIISSGTWTISMNMDGDISRLDHSRDMLANVDITGQPICCARFMGGREYASIRNQLETGVETKVEEGDIQGVINSEVFALPDFSDGCGPFAGQIPKIIGTPRSARSLAAIYCALMIDVELDLLEATDPIVIEGSFAENEMICKLVATIRPHQHVFKLKDKSGVAHGCLSLAKWKSTAHFSPELNLCSKINLTSLGSYRKLWRDHCANNQRKNYA